MHQGGYADVLRPTMVGILRGGKCCLDGTMTDLFIHLLVTAGIRAPAQGAAERGALPGPFVIFSVTDVIVSATDVIDSVTDPSLCPRFCELCHRVCGSHRVCGTRRRFSDTSH